MIGLQLANDVWILVLDLVHFTCQKPLHRIILRTSPGLDWLVCDLGSSILNSWSSFFNKEMPIRIHVWGFQVPDCDWLQLAKEFGSLFWIFRFTSTKKTNRIILRTSPRLDWFFAKGSVLLVRFLNSCQFNDQPYQSEDQCFGFQIRIPITYSCANEVRFFGLGIFNMRKQSLIIQEDEVPDGLVFCHRIYWVY